MRVGKALLVAFFLLLSAFNAGVLAVWWHSSEKTMLMPNPSGYTVEALALSVTMLEMVIVLVGFVLAALALFGYTEIKEAAIRRAVQAAEDEARKTVSEQFVIWEATRQAAPQSPAEHAGSYGLGDQSISGATTPGKE